MLNVKIESDSDTVKKYICGSCVGFETYSLISFSSHLSEHNLQDRNIKDKISSDVSTSKEIDIERNESSGRILRKRKLPKHFQDFVKEESLELTENEYSESSETSGHEFSEIDSSEEINQENLENNLENISELKVTHKIEYSLTLLNEFIEGKDEDFASELKEKLEKLKKYSIGAKVVDGVRYYVCMDCLYETNRYTSDIRRHIMISHCLIKRNLLYIAKVVKSNFVPKKLNNYKKPKKTKIFNLIYEKDFDVLSTFTMTYSEESFQDKSSSDIKDLKSELDKLKEKRIGIIIIDNVQFFVCMECYFKTRAHLYDMKVHILSKHSNIKPSLQTSCSKLLYKEQVMKRQKRETKVKQRQEESISENENEEEISNKVIYKKDFDSIQNTFTMTYSEESLMEVFHNKSSSTIRDLKLKLDNLKEKKIGTTVINNLQYLVCLECNYRAKGSFYLVKRHIFNVHCDIEKRLRKSCSKLMYQEDKIDINVSRKKRLN